ncbi:MAG TPA: PfkB family carbohydrate kinase [Woeseiaceae bacterium]|nr:PfkB family carbohydrate kinase [Woeseiaceae bacterium]
MANTRKIAVIGECMIELRPNITDAGYSTSTIDAQIGYGGDTLNVATYLARQGIAVDYVTMLGDDPLSDWMVEQWRGNGVSCDLVRREERGLPGMYRITDIALPSADDDRQLFNDDSNDAVIERLRSWGIREIVLKRGSEGSLVADDASVVHVPPVLVEDVVDTTAAGDSFNAGYLAARIRGASPEDAAKNGSKLAALVVQHRGAIIPRDAMPASS